MNFFLIVINLKEEEVEYNYYVFTIEELQSNENEANFMEREYFKVM